MSQAYGGTRRKLLLALDVGTTYSGISYSVLDPGNIPIIKGVTHFPAQENIASSSKIPTIIYYDRAGSPKAIGAEAIDQGINERAEEGGWIKVEWFKLHLRPDPQNTPEITERLPPLPVGKTAVDVLADFLRYLFECARRFIVDSESNGIDLWDSLHNRIEFVLSHPNGWEGIQQSKVRKAAVLAGLVRDTDDGSRQISFVTEGEASLHYAIRNGLPPNALRSGDGVAIVDAGGGTIDISTYTQGNNPKRRVFEEIARPQCHFKGSVFVTMAAKIFVEDFLARSNYLPDVDNIVQAFDKTTKLRFRNDKDNQYVRFGSSRDNDRDFKINHGQLTLQGRDVATFFAGSIQSIVDGVKLQRRTSLKPFTHVVLVGGFAVNDWLFNQVRSQLGVLGYTVVRPLPDNHVGKAVADGAISFYINRNVQTRISRITYGTKGSIDYDSSNPQHQGRQTFTSVSDMRRIDNVFWIVLDDNQQVAEDNEIKRTFYWEFKDTSGLSRARAYLYCCRGRTRDAAFMDDEPNRFSQLCTIEVDLSHLADSSMVESLRTRSGEKYFKLSYEVALLLGDTEIKAKLVWKEGGQERWSPAKILYAEDLPAEDPIDETYVPPPPASVENFDPRRYDDARSIRSSRSVAQPHPAIMGLFSRSSSSGGSFREKYDSDEDNYDSDDVDDEDPFVSSEKPIIYGRWS